MNHIILQNMYCPRLRPLAPKKSNSPFNAYRHCECSHHNNNSKKEKLVVSFGRQSYVYVCVCRECFPLGWKNKIDKVDMGCDQRLHSNDKGLWPTTTLCVCVYMCFRVIVIYVWLMRLFIHKDIIKSSCTGLLCICFCKIFILYLSCGVREYLFSTIYKPFSFRFFFAVENPNTDLSVIDGNYDDGDEDQSDADGEEEG